MLNLLSGIRGRRSILALLALAWFISRAAILLSVDPDETDVELYFRYAVEGVDLHHVPYRDFDVEYPPLAYWFIALPRLVDPAAVPADTFEQPLSHSAAFHRYGHLYEAQAVVCDALAFVLLLMSARRRWPEHFVFLGAVYLAVTTLLWPVLFVRLDIGLTVLLMAWAFYWLKSIDSAAHAGRNRLLSYLALGLSVGFKLVPVLAVPFVLLCELRSARPLRQFSQALLVLAVTVIVPFVLHWPSAGAGSLKLFAFHGQRGIQVESLYATVLAAAGPECWPPRLEKSFGSWNVDAPLAPSLKTGSSVVLLGLLAALGLWSLFQGRRYTPIRALGVACLVICGSVIVAKVVSPQYFTWALPVALLLSAAVLPPRWPAWLLAGVSLAAVARLTTWVFPYHYRELLEPALNTLPWLVLAGRNVLYLGLVVWLGGRMLSSDPVGEPPNSLSLDGDLRCDAAHVSATPQSRSVKVSA